ncbi:tripartite tricarboxylate transporter TctB family protein [Caballeronia sp. GAFFF2]|uniref:tripartite tricarboxylate transporter TctB family protein n=1 Tax=Caballeronia sp. GAFFF2 TaxID=2921741 RepID=UPI0020284765|nr:tripartite tricarboxylate transporter TctB family protein [Caballeronia sp. GAFFF2]
MKAITIRNTRLAAGLVFAAIGLMGGIYACQYRLGTATDMGPGYFPLGVSGMLALLGLTNMLIGWRKGADDEAVKLSPTALIIVVGIVLFGIVLKAFGFAPAVAVLSAIVCYQRWRERPIEVLILTVLLTAVCCVLFVYLLGMPFALLK